MVYNIIQHHIIKMILVRKKTAIFSLRAEGIINGFCTISTQLIDDLIQHHITSYNIV